MRYLLILLGLLLLPHQVDAMIFAPTSADIHVMPGESVAIPLVVENTDEYTRNYAVSLYSVRFSAESDEPIFSSLSQSVTPWIELDAYNFSLSAAKEKALTLTVAPPDITSADSFVIGVVIRELAPANSASVVSGVSSLVFVTVGSPPVSFDLVEMRVWPSFTSSVPIDITTTIKNTGERVLQPTGNVIIHNTFGKQVAEYDVNPMLRRIPTSQTRAYTVTWGEQREVENFFQELWRECTNFKVGVFTATFLAAPYPDSDVPMEAATRFVVFPWRLALVALGLVTLGGFARYRRR